MTTHMNIGTGFAPLEDIDALGMPEGGEQFMSDDLYDMPDMWNEPEGEIPEIEIPTAGWGDMMPEPMTAREYVESGGMSNDYSGGSDVGMGGGMDMAGLGGDPSMGAMAGGDLSMMGGSMAGGPGPMTSSKPPAADALASFAQDRDVRAKQFQSRATGLGSKYGL